MYGTLLCLMLRHNSQECTRFRQSRIPQSLYTITEVLVSSDVMATPFNIVHEDRSRLKEFSLMTTFTELAAALRYSSEPESQLAMLHSGVESDISTILDLLQRFRGAIWRQLLLLYTLMDVLKVGGSTVAALWKSCQGYERLVALFSSLDLTADSASHERVFRIMDLVLELLNVTLDSQHGNDDNVEYFRSIDGYATIASCIITSGVMKTTKRKALLQRILDLIASGVSQTEIRNGDAVQIVFRLLPTVSDSDAIDTMTKLISMLEIVNDGSSISKKERTIRLVRAGVFQWMDDPDLILKLKNAEDPLNPYLVKWLTTIVLEEDLSIPHLHDVLKLVGKAMPKLLSNLCCCKETSEDTTSTEIPETGLLLLQNLLRNPAIRNIYVGKPQGSGQTGRYVHIVNSTERVWPPSSGYSFSCWLRFPALPARDDSKSPTSKTTTSLARLTVSVPLCEGNLTLTPDDDQEERMSVYGVLVGTTLTLFTSKEASAHHENATGELNVASIARKGPLEWSFVSDTRVILASCTDADTMEMWWRAMEQCNSARMPAGQSLSTNTLLTSFGVLSDGDPGVNKPVEDPQSGSEEGSACIVSIYSLEASGCFIRAFFEHSTGFLRFHTGTVNSGPSMNPNPKRTSVVFDAVAIENLRPAATSNGGNSNDVCASHIEQTEHKRDWHHFAFTHRKSVVGSSLITVYIDGQEIATKKLNYPSAPAVGSFQAFVGSDAQVCSPHSALSWKIGPAWFTDEVIPSGTIAGIFSLGPTFSHQFSGHSYRSDVRELIPEFFYLPEFLYNANNCVFGTTQSGEEVWHVILPTWAHGDPREFVRLNRRALESKYVSEHLHEWIDLVFGAKQTGQAAVNAQNVFMNFTYEGTVDIEQITDPVMRAATLAQIENFGQTPSRLFSSPHPQRKVPTLIPTSATEASSMNSSAGHQYDGMTLSTIESYVKWHTPLAPALVAIGKDYVFMKKHSAISVQVNGTAIGDVKFVHDKMQCQGVGCSFMPPRYAKYLDWGNNSGVMKLRVHQQHPGSGRYREANKILAVVEGAHHGGINSASVSDDGALLVTGGEDAVVNLIECSKDSDGRRVFKQAAKFVGHNDAVVCVAINKEFNLIASSSADRSVLLWDLRTRALLQELAGHAATVSHVSINSANGNVLTTTSSEIRLWSINGDLLAASSSSTFGLQAIVSGFRRKYALGFILTLVLVVMCDLDAL
ncbi:hypothetical protein AM588_10011252 [Phytophthora nicotianae]|uniref:BEACH domain-containing protein n=1 Tax=Phytophthora nicotianae TaxID=4792 RepID=A0A0W8DP98_PHYNI|nr:hypothetical protein AM588_10011252 [Phytophthora nicotianae]